MADFCRQCSIEMCFDEPGDLAGITPPDAWAAGKACIVLCEGCGAIQVDPEGYCISNDCLEKHGLTYEKIKKDA